MQPKNNMAVSYMYDIEEGSQRLNMQESHKMHDSTIDKNAEIQEGRKQASSYCTQYPIFIPVCPIIYAYVINIKRVDGTLLCKG